MCIVQNDALTRTKKNTYCSFVSRTFAEGRGIAILTTVANSEVITSFAAFTDPDSIAGMNDLIEGEFGPPAFFQKYMPGKGFGTIANRTIYRGERILQETPSMVYDRSTFEELDDEDRVPMHWNMVYQLPEETRVELLALHVQRVGDHVDDIMRTNAFGALYSEDDLHNNMLPRISRHNHDCRPK
jgi:hypothetical protein